MGAKRVLVVDDEAQIVEVLRDSLETDGYAVDAATTGEEALRLVRANLYDAAIIDFVLPDMNGIVLHRAMRQMDEELAESTLFISGYVQGQTELGYYHASGGGFLAKPFQIWEVRRRVRAMTESEEEDQRS